LSSRNRYLDDQQREEATVLHRSLLAGQRDAERGPDSALGAARAELRRVHAVDLDYLAVTDPDLGPAPARGPGRMLIAARIGTTRLIDNVPLQLGDPGTDR
jgi:pantoate--beta-alanine ligase